MPFNPDSSLQAEIATQPDDWARVVSRVGEVHAALPAAGARLAVVGCGTSFYMAQAYRRAARAGRAGRDRRLRRQRAQAAPRVRRASW